MSQYLTNAQFRLDFPAFSNETTFPDSEVSYWLMVAGLLLTPRWGALSQTSTPAEADVGTELFIAHNLALEAQANAAANSGAVPGTATGAISGKTIGPVKVDYDNASSMEPGAGHWNLTTYGKRFIRLAKLMGAGPMQIGTGGGCAPPFSGPAYQGPIVDRGFGQD